MRCAYHMSNKNDIKKLLPESIKNILNTGFIDNMFNQMLSSDESEQLIGYIGDKTSDDFYVSHEDLDRSLSPLQPVFYARHGTEEFSYTLKDVLNRAKILGLNVDKFDEWGATQSFNYAFPINLDMFCNYSKYRWYGHLSGDTGLPYNSDLSDPEYIVMHSSYANDWSSVNYWVHEDDVSSIPGIDVNATVQATRPIINYNEGIELNTQIINNVPVSSGGIVYTQNKLLAHQYPLFNLYNSKGTFEKVGSLISYVTDANASADSQLKIKVKRNANGDYIFSTDLIDVDNKLLSYNDGNLQTVWHAGDNISPRYVTIDDNENVVDIDPETDIAGAGEWMIPDQIYYNLNHENRNEFSFGDVYNHFTDIIANQQGFIGSEFGTNNYRNLASIDYGVGGRIKDFNGNYNLFISLMLQREMNVESLLSLSQTSYDSKIEDVKKFCIDNIVETITDNDMTFPQSFGEYSSIYGVLTDLFKADIEQRTDDLFLATTSGITGWPASLANIGIVPKSTPSYSFDATDGSVLISHHDGHLSESYVATDEINEKLVSLFVMRSNGSKVPGVKSSTVPIRPFKKQLWLNTDENALYVFDVIGDGPALPGSANIGEYWYVRDQNEIYVWQASGWTLVTDVTAPWVEFKYDLIINEVLLEIENILYDNVLTSNVNYDYTNVMMTADFTTMLNEYFNAYAVSQNLDLGYTDYDSSDAFTWNYSSESLFTLGNFARWWDIYRAYYGTERPDLEPWYLQGYTDKPLWWDTQYLLPSGEYSSTMWDDIVNDSGPQPAPTGAWTGIISVNFSTNELLPPYIDPADPLANHSLYLTEPASAADAYVLGDNGPLEYAWKKTIDYLYSIIKCVYRNDPINFIAENWGYSFYELSEYQINSKFAKKTNQNDIQIHGELLVDQVQNIDVNTFTIVTSVSEPYTIEVARIQGSDVFYKVYTTDRDEFETFKNSELYDNGEFSISFVINNETPNVGDRFVVTENGYTFTSATLYKTHGLVQYIKNYFDYSNIDDFVSLSNTLLRNWEVYLGYRVSGLLSTDSLKIKTDTYQMTEDDYNTVIKQNFREEDFWLNGIRVQLTRRGAYDRGTNNEIIPRNLGDDWEYRIELLNADKGSLDYYEFDTTSKRSSVKVNTPFGGEIIIKRYTKKTNLQSIQAPFYVKGIQNVVDILYGYVEHLNEMGWKVDNKDEYIDPVTGASLSWNTEIMRFVYEQYNGAIAGTGVILSPFRGKIIFESDYGVVSTFENNIVTDSRNVPAIYDVSGNIVDLETVRTYRNKNSIEIHCDDLMYGCHLFRDSYEHIILFENYALNSETNRQYLVYDPFLGVNLPRIYIDCFKQKDANGTLSYDGHYVVGKDVKKNIDSNVNSLQTMFDRNTIREGDAFSDVAKQLVGYHDLPFMEEMNLTDKSKFLFWQGFIKNKGSNYSVDAFLNNSDFTDAEIDEYWAYKLAEYGDARDDITPEIRMLPSDAKTQHIRYQFTDGEADPRFNVITSGSDRWVSYGDSVINDFKLSKKITILDVNISGAQDIMLVDDEGNDIHADDVVIYRKDDSLKTPLLQGLAYGHVTSNVVRIHNPNISGDHIIECITPSDAVNSPMSIIDYKSRNKIADIPMWDPLRNLHAQRPMVDVDTMHPTDPARYNVSVTTAGNRNYSPRSAWSDESVGKVWWDTSLLSYIPYSDIARIDNGINYWGSKADYSEVKINQWTESPVPPVDYEQYVADQFESTDVPQSDKPTGQPAIKNYYTRERQWEYRPLAWKYSVNANSSAFDYKATYADVYINKTLIDSAILYSDELLEDHEGNACFLNVDVPVGEIADIEYSSVVYGSDVDVTDVDFAGTNISSSRIEGEAELGSYIFNSTSTDAITLHRLSDGANEEVVLADTPENAGSRMTIEFQTLDVTVSFIVGFSHGDAGATTSQERIDLIRDDLNSKIFVARASYDCKINLPIDDAIVAPSLTIGGSDLYTLDSFVLYDSPENYEEDLPAPNNKWVQVYGEWNNIPENTGDIYTTIKQYEETPFVNSDGDSLLKFRYTFGQWNTLNNEIKSATFLPAINYTDTRLTELTGYGFITSSYTIGDLTYTTTKATNLINYVNAHAYTHMDPALDELYQVGQSGGNQMNHATTYWVAVTEGLENVITDYLFDVIKVPSNAIDADLTFDSEIDESRLSVYVNGIIQPTASYTVFNNAGTSLVKPNAVSEGDNIVCLYTKYIPSDEDLSFDASETNEPSQLNEYKVDYPYTVENKRDDSGQLTPMYYFWVTGKTIKDGTKMSLVDIASALTYNDDPYFVVRYNEDDKEYDKLVIQNSKSLIASREGFKLQLIKNEILRDNADGLNKKNVHTEWKLIRRGQLSKIPKALWDAVVDAVCGEDIAGNTVPSLAYQRYDADHGTNYRYGIGPGKIFTDSILAIATVKHRLSEFYNDPSILGGSSIEFLDLSDIDALFQNSTTSRETMNTIWLKGIPTVINYIFFDVLEDAIASNLEFSDIIKTSYISAKTVTNV